MSPALAVPAGWGFRPYTPVERRRQVRGASLYRRVIARLLEDPALLDVPHAVLVRDAQEAFQLNGAQARWAVLTAAWILEGRPSHLLPLAPPC